MKRVLETQEKDKKTKKKMKEDPEKELQQETSFVNLNGDLLFEILKHVDARSLAYAACVNKQWNETARDERLWEIICTRHWANTGCGPQRFRSVVLALGGFRGLHSQCLVPLRKPPSLSSSSSSSSSSSVHPALPSAPIPWGKDEVQLSLSLLSVRYFEKMKNHKGDLWT